MPKLPWLKDSGQLLLGMHLQGKQLACLAPLGFSEARLLGMRLLGRGYWPSMAKHTVSVGQNEEVVERETENDPHKENKDED